MKVIGTGAGSQAFGRATFLGHIGWFGARILIWSRRLVWMAQFSLAHTFKLGIRSGSVTIRL